MDEEKLIKEWEDHGTVFDNLRASFTHPTGRPIPQSV